MSGDRRQSDPAFRVPVLWGLIGCAGLVVADDAVAPDIAFLEYLGSWEESDEDWVLFTEMAAEQLASEMTRTDPDPKEEESVETDDES